MAKYIVHLRYYPGDPLEEIRRTDLDRIAGAHGVEVSFEKMDHRDMVDGKLREETLDWPLEEISQEIITIRSEDEPRFRRAVEAIYDRYRSPRTPYGFWGSSPEGARLAKTVADETGGGW